MEQKFIVAYDRLSINDKRNELCNELIVMSEYIKYIELYLGYKNEKIKIKNYNILKNKDKSETQILTDFYENVYILERELELIIELIRYKKI